MSQLLTDMQLRIGFFYSLLAGHITCYFTGAYEVIFQKVSELFGWKEFALSTKSGQVWFFWIVLLALIVYPLWHLIFSIITIPYHSSARPAYLNPFYEPLRKGLSNSQYFKQRLLYGYRAIMHRVFWTYPDFDQLQSMEGEVLRVYEVLKDNHRDVVTIVLQDDGGGNDTTLELPGIYFGIEDARNSDSLELDAQVARWFRESIRFKVGCVVTNTRMLEPSEAGEVYRQVSERIEKLARAERVNVRFFLRTDSTLRANFLEEWSAVRKIARPSFTVFAPAYPDQERITFHGIQFFKNEQGQFEFVHRSEQAKIPGLSYKRSELCTWLMERSNGQIGASDVFLIPIAEIRSLPFEQLVEKFEHPRISEKSIVVIDALDSDDCVKIAQLCIELENRGKKPLIRSTVSVLQSFMGENQANQQVVANLTPRTRQIASSARCINGICIVGSLTNRSKKQTFNTIKKLNNSLIVFDRDLVDRPEEYVERIIDSIVVRKQNVVLTTWRWQEDGTLYPSTDVRRRVLNTMRDILASLVISLRQHSPPIVLPWLILKGSDTGYFCIRYGLKTRFINYCGNVKSGITIARIPDVNHPFSNIPIILMAGNAGKTEDLAQLMLESDENHLLNSDEMNRIRNAK